MDLEARLRHRLSLVEKCSHQMCSMTDEASEHNEAVAIRKMLCAHERWKIFNGQEWVIAPFNATEPGGCYCADCGAAPYELTPDDLASASSQQEKP